MATEYFPNIVDFLSNVNVSGILSAVTFQSEDSVKWNSTYTTVQQNSSTNWTQTLSFDELTKDLSIFSGNTVSLSAFGTGADTELRALSANWQETYNTVVANSSTNWNNKPEWDSVYTTVYTNSANWEAAVSYIQRFDYVSDGVDYSYSGVAVDGTLETDPSWKITRLVFEDVGSLSSIGVAENVTWLERLTATYV